MNEETGEGKAKALKDLQARAQVLDAWFDNVQFEVFRSADLTLSEDAIAELKTETLTRLDETLDFLHRLTEHVRGCMNKMDIADAVFLGRLLIGSAQTLIAVVSEMTREAHCGWSV